MSCSCSTSSPARWCRRIVLPVPSSLGKGVLVSPTIYGNVMLGPTAEDLTDRTATGTSEAGLEYLLEKGRRLMPTPARRGGHRHLCRAPRGHRRDDYLIDLDAERRYLLVGGIRSTGLTAGMAIAEHVRGLLASTGLDLTDRDDLRRAAADAQPR